MLELFDSIKDGSWVGDFIAVGHSLVSWGLGVAVKRCSGDGEDWMALTFWDMEFFITSHDGLYYSS